MSQLVPWGVTNRVHKYIVCTTSDHHFFSEFLKKITMTKLSANFLSPEPNGQGACVLVEPREPLTYLKTNGNYYVMIN